MAKRPNPKIDRYSLELMTLDWDRDCRPDGVRRKRQGRRMVHVMADDTQTMCGHRFTGPRVTPGVTTPAATCLGCLQRLLHNVDWGADSGWARPLMMKLDAKLLSGGNMPVARL